MSCESDILLAISWRDWWKFQRGYVWWARYNLMRILSHPYARIRSSGRFENPGSPKMATAARGQGLWTIFCGFSASLFARVARLWLRQQIRFRPPSPNGPTLICLRPALRY
ncbi:Rab11 family-interacting protein 2 [Anopheles sinensis]|uniref:Rab11 family-interacting protein 2 n=1 Tax=Anopheles sinensis TaxID=74873 RepID=A0A084WMY6_ANOSI|nr:Rab11 family-interacting protein 2 [Anopheles sinensis]